MSATSPTLARGEYSRARRIKNALKSALTNPYNLIVLISLLFLTYLIVVPLADMIRTTFTLSKTDVRQVEGGSVGQFTLYYWNRVLASNLSAKLLYKPLLNSLMIGVLVSVISITLGSCVAWLIVRSDIPFKRFFSLAVILPYMLPSWCKSFAWLTVFKNERVGGSQGFLNAMGIDTPNWIAYGPFAIICVLSLHYFAYSYLLVSAALSSINSELEEMGEIAGAGKGRILRKITIPLVLPAILSSFILTFSKAIGTFGVPAFLGMKIGYYTISTQLYNLVKQRQTNTGFTMSLVLIAIASITVYLNQRAIGVRKNYTTIGGKGGRSTPIPLGKWKWPLVAFLIVFILISVVLPLSILLLQTFMLRSGTYSLENFSLHYWIGQGRVDVNAGEPGVFRNPQFWKYVGNTMKLVVFTSLMATFLGQVIGYICARGRAKRSGRLVEQLTFIPYLIPSIAFGAIYLSMFSNAKSAIFFGKFQITLVPALYGTFFLLILISAVKNLPFSVRAGTSNMLQIGAELEEAAQIEGAGFFRRFGRVVLPLSKAGFMSGFMLIFINIMKELDLIVVLMTPSQQTLPYMAYSYQSQGFDQLSNVVAVIIFAIVLVVYILATKLTHADLAKGIGG